MKIAQPFMAGFTMRNKPSPVRDERIMAVRKDLPCLTGLFPNVRQPPSLERLGYFQTTSAVRRGIVVCSQNQTRFQAPFGGRAPAPEYAAPTGLACRAVVGRRRGNWVARVATKISFLTELSDNRNAVAAFSPALERSDYAG